LVGSDKQVVHVQACSQGWFEGFISNPLNELAIVSHDYYAYSCRSWQDKKDQCCVVHGSKKQFQHSTKQIAMRTLADDSKRCPKNFPALCMVSRLLHSLCLETCSASRWD